MPKRNYFQTKWFLCSCVIIQNKYRPIFAEWIIKLSEKCAEWIYNVSPIAQLWMAFIKKENYKRQETTLGWLDWPIGKGNLPQCVVCRSSLIYLIKSRLPGEKKILRYVSSTSSSRVADVSLIWSYQSCRISFIFTENRTQLL